MVGLPACLRVFLFSKNLQTKCGAHTASYSVNLRGCFTGGKTYRHEADRCTPSSAGIMNEWCCTHSFFCIVLLCTGPNITILTPELSPPDCHLMQECQFPLLLPIQKTRRCSRLHSLWTCLSRRLPSPTHPFVETFILFQLRENWEVQKNLVTQFEVPLSDPVEAASLFRRQIQEFRYVLKPYCALNSMDRS